MRRSNSTEGTAASAKEVEQLRSDLDRALSPELEKNATLGEDHLQKPANQDSQTQTIKGRPVPVVPKGSAMSKALAGQYPEGSGVTYAANDTSAFWSQHAPSTTNHAGHPRSDQEQGFTRWSDSTKRRWCKTGDCDGWTTGKRQELYYKEVGAILELVAARHEDLQRWREETRRGRWTQHAGEDN
jgi:hypothetical protein